jgi:uracil-DNA glycosylase
MDLFRQCALCRQCDGAAYQSPPALSLGPDDAPIVIIAQNPGEIHSDDKFRLAMADAMLTVASEETSGTFLRAWYSADYLTSGSAATMTKVLGDDWLRSGRYLYTNAVRCRTPGNNKPSREMIDACSTWTRKVFFAHKRDGVILLGALAAEQLLGKLASKISVGEYKHHPVLGLVLRLSHPATWKTGGNLTVVRNTINKYLSELGGHDAHR